ncbi:MAG: ester cyclase [Actinomycetota bacterium]|nr:ester cyclase [Actinomycetota bacterium]
MEIDVTNTHADTHSPRTANAEVVARLWKEAFNDGDLDVLPELVRAEFKNFDVTTDGPEFLRSLITAQRSAFPDMHFTPLQVVADDDWVVTKARWMGTFLAPFTFIGFDGIKPTGRRFDVEHVHAFGFVDGKIAEHWAVRDDHTMHNQLLGDVL